MAYKSNRKMLIRIGCTSIQIGELKSIGGYVNLDTESNSYTVDMITFKDQIREVGGTYVKYSFPSGYGYVNYTNEAIVTVQSLFSGNKLIKLVFFPDYDGNKEEKTFYGKVLVKKSTKSHYLTPVLSITPITKLTLK